MDEERIGRDRSEPVFVLRLEEASAARPDAVYELLADLRRHLAWGGTEQKKGYRLMSLEAPEGRATVGTEFRTVGKDPGGRFDDTSVVTEATPPSVFEFVTTARQQPKRGEPIVWTNVHRYEIAATERGCRIGYTLSVMRLSRRTWWQSRLGKRIVRIVGGSNSRVGLRNLARMAERRRDVAAAA